MFGFSRSPAKVTDVAVDLAVSKIFRVLGTSLIRGHVKYLDDTHSFSAYYGDSVVPAWVMRWNDGIPSVNRMNPTVTRHDVGTLNSKVSDLVKILHNTVKTNIGGYSLLTISCDDKDVTVTLRLSDGSYNVINLSLAYQQFLNLAAQFDREAMAKAVTACPEDVVNEMEKDFMDYVLSYHQLRSSDGNRKEFEVLKPDSSNTHYTGVMKYALLFFVGMEICNAVYGDVECPSVGQVKYCIFNDSYRHVEGAQYTVLHELGISQHNVEVYTEPVAALVLTKLGYWRLSLLNELILLKIPAGRYEISDESGTYRFDWVKGFLN